MRGLLTAHFLFAGGMKLITPVVVLAAMFPFPGEFLSFIGICEMLGAFGLILPWVPHVQLDQLAPPEMHATLMARVFALPDIEERLGTVADPRESAIWLRDDLPAGPADAFLGNREIGHFHPWDRSLHIALPPELAVAIVDSVNLTRYLEIRSVARLVPDSEAELTDRLAKKYLGLDRFPYLQPGEERVQVVVAARHATNQ